MSAPLLGNLEIPSESVRGVVLQPLADQSAFLEALNNRPPDQDRVIAQTSAGQQSVFGLIESINDAKLSLNQQGKSRLVSLPKIVAVVTADLQPAAPTGTECQLHLTDGSTLVGSISQMSEGTIKVKVSGGHVLEFAWNAVASVTVRSDRVAYLSDLDPVEAVHSPLATSEFQWQRDKSVAGNPISFLGPGDSEKTFVKGIGTHSASRLEFTNDGFDHFAATVGIDAETLGRGDCIASVWADGIELWSARITGRTPPQKVDVDIQGMERVALVVQAGQHLDLGDHVDWANARFLKTRQ